MLHTALHNAKPTRAKILVVEDDDGLAEEIMHELQGLGFEMTRERDAPAALDRTESDRFNYSSLIACSAPLTGFPSWSRCARKTTRFRFWLSAR
jgi:DNA-binding response OmpR family regulator